MTARAGMTQIINDLRVLTEGGTAEWTLGTITFWDDDQMQNVLDKHVTEFVFRPMLAIPTYDTDGLLAYNDYEIGIGNIEQTTGGTSIFYIQDGNFDIAGTALYSADYRKGKFTFATNTQGTTSFYATGKSYDLNASAAEIWRIKANHVANTFDFSTDNTSVKKSQIFDHYNERADYFESIATTGVSHVSLKRSDDVIG